MFFIVNGSRYLIDYSSINVEITLKFKNNCWFSWFETAGRCQGENRQRNPPNNPARPRAGRFTKIKQLFTCFITRNCPKNEYVRKSFLIKEIFYDPEKSFMTQKTFPKSVENSFEKIDSEYIFVFQVVSRNKNFNYMR